MAEENKEEVYESDFMFQNNAVNAEPVFPSPFNSKIGNSTIDLSDKLVLIQTIYSGNTKLDKDVHDVISYIKNIGQPAKNFESFTMKQDLYNEMYTILNNYKRNQIERFFENL